VLEAVINTGFDVRALVVDGTPKNINMFRRLGCRPGEPVFTLLGKKIVAIIDPPHLVKAIRNKLMKYDFKSGEKTAKWEHIVKFEEIDATYPARIAPKLTAGHFHHNREKMRVDRAAQVLSAHFAAGIYVHCDGGRLPAEARDTADAVLMFDRLFDSFNGTKKAASMTQPVLKEYHVAMDETSKHTQL